MTISLVLFSTVIRHSIRSTIFAGKLLGCSLIWQRTLKFNGSLRYCLPGKLSHGSLLSCSPRTITRLFIINFMSPRSGLDWYQENFVSRFSLAWITNSCLFLISAAGTFPLIPATYFHQEPGTSYQSPIKVSHKRISLEVADLLAVRCVVKAFKTRCTEKTRIFTRQGIINGHPPETQKFSWAIVCPFTVVDGSMLIIERLTANVNLYHVTKFPPSLSFTVYYSYWKISHFTPALSIRIVLESFYLLISILRHSQLDSDATSTFLIMHLICPPPHPPPFLHDLCFSSLPGITAVPGEIENNAYAKFCGGGGQIRGIMGNVEVAYK